MTTASGATVGSIELAGGGIVSRGVLRRRTELGPRAPVEGICALQAASLPWLRERDVAVVGADTGNDVMPAQYPLALF